MGSALKKPVILKFCAFSAIINLLKLAELRVYKIFVSLPLFSVWNGYKSADWHLYYAISQCVGV